MRPRIAPNTRSWSYWRRISRLIPDYDPFETAQGSTFDVKKAGIACAFVETFLTHTEGELGGKPFLLEDWQRAIIATLFGWYRPDGTRRYREAFILIPRKNGKTALASAINLLVLICDNEPGAQLYSAAGSKDQASLIFRNCRSMILAEPMLKKELRILRGYRMIERGASIYRALTKEGETNHGLNTHFAVIDEVHAIKNRDMVDAITTSTGARRSPLVVYITTADYKRISICNEKYEYARHVRDGDPGFEDEAFLPVLYEATISDDWTDPKVWRRSNPNLGISVKEDYIRRECLKAQRTPSYENTFKRLHLNIQTEQEFRWIVMEKWEASAGVIDLEELEGEPCFGGLDLSQSKDLTSFSLVFPREVPAGEEPLYKVLVWFWVPGKSAKRREEEDRVPYLTWQKQGHISFAGNEVIDYLAVRRKIVELSKRYEIQEVAYDPYNAQATANELEEAGISTFKFAQSFNNYTEPTNELERLYLLRRFHHGGNPVLWWNASNVVAEENGSGGIRPSKRKSTERIDGIIASVMALARALLAEREKESLYKTRGLP